MENIILAAEISLGLQIFGFFIAFALRTDKLTDLFYGLSFAIIAWSVLFTNMTLPGIVLASMITIWGARLSGYLFIRIIKIKKDDRFDQIRGNFFKFAGFWLLQAVSVFLISLSTTIYLGKNKGTFTIFAIIGGLVWLKGFLIETIADIQKYRFINDKKNKGKWVSTGLWKRSRHPNYFGEAMLWWGIFIYAIPVLQGIEWVSLISPITISGLLLFVSGIPILEKKMDKKYGHDPDYQKYKKETPVLIPKLF